MYSIKINIFNILSQLDYPVFQTSLWYLSCIYKQLVDIFYMKTSLTYKMLITCFHVNNC